MIITKKDYNIEDLVFLKGKPHLFLGRNNPVYPMESISIEEKIAMMDDFEDGLASYMLDILTRYNSDKETMPKGQWGEVKTTSLKAWVKRNDSRKIIYRYEGQSEYNSYYMFGTEFKNLDLVCPSHKYGSSMMYTGDDIVKQWFHDFIIKMIREEQTWFNDNDPHMLKLRRVRELGDRYGVFGNKLLNDITHNHGDVSEKELDFFLEQFVEVEKLFADIKQKISNEIGNMFE